MRIHLFQERISTTCTRVHSFEDSRLFMRYERCCLVHTNGPYAGKSEYPFSFLILKISVRKCASIRPLLLKYVFKKKNSNEDCFMLLHDDYIIFCAELDTLVLVYIRWYSVGFSFL